MLAIVKYFVAGLIIFGVQAELGMDSQYEDQTIQNYGRDVNMDPQYTLSQQIPQDYARASNMNSQYIQQNPAAQQAPQIYGNGANMDPNLPYTPQYRASQQSERYQNPLPVRKNVGYSGISDCDLGRLLSLIMGIVR